MSIMKYSGQLFKFPVTHCLVITYGMHATNIRFKHNIRVTMSVHMLHCQQHIQLQIDLSISITINPLRWYFFLPFSVTFVCVRCIYELRYSDKLTTTQKWNVFNLHTVWSSPCCLTFIWTIKLFCFQQVIFYQKDKDFI